MSSKPPHPPSESPQILLPANRIYHLMTKTTQNGASNPNSTAGFLDAAHSTAGKPTVEQKAAAGQTPDPIEADFATKLARIKADKDAGDINLLLLGQSESGKSTLLKQYRMIFERDSFEAERKTWRPVILLNVFNTVRNVLSVAKEARERGYSEASDIDLHLLEQVEEKRSEFGVCEEKLVKMLIRSGHVQSSVPPGTESQKVLVKRLSHENVSSSTFTALDSTDLRELNSIAWILESMQDRLVMLWRDPGIQRLTRQRLQEDWRE
jgi:hypothetical protein